MVPRVILLIVLSTSALVAQSDEEKNFSSLVDEERRQLLDSLSDLSIEKQQKIKWIYEDFVQDFYRMMRVTERKGQRAARKERLLILTATKNKSLKKILNYRQYKIYQAILKQRKSKLSDGYVGDKME